MPANSSDNPAHLEKIIDTLLSKLEETDPGTQEFSAIVDQLDKLYKMSPKKDTWVKPELLIPVAGNLAGILAILNFERVHVVASKAVGFVIKTRL